MTETLAPPAAQATRGHQLLKVVLCGSFRRDFAGLRHAFAILDQHFELIGPSALDFVDLDADFVRLASERDHSPATIEAVHLERIRRADFVWLHAYQGYVGTSAAMEIGHAVAAGVPVYTDSRLMDGTLDQMVNHVATPLGVDISEHVRPGYGIQSLQAYYERIAARRGWAEESPRDTMLLLTEEIGELARAVRKTAGLERAGGYAGVEIESEVADVQLYLVHLANALGASAVEAKERVNTERFKAKLSA
jgi:NTP pyrophosphatase (non-canonical NTP hydrolase)